MPKIISEHNVCKAVVYKLMATPTMIQILLLPYFSCSFYTNYHLSTSNSIMDSKPNLLGLKTRQWAQSASWRPLWHTYWANQIPFPILQAIKSIYFISQASLHLRGFMRPTSVNDVEEAKELLGKLLCSLKGVYTSDILS